MMKILNPAAQRTRWFQLSEKAPHIHSGAAGPNPSDSSDSKSNFKEFGAVSELRMSNLLAFKVVAQALENSQSFSLEDSGAMSLIASMSLPADLSNPANYPVGEVVCLQDFWDGTTVTM